MHSSNLRGTDFAINLAGAAIPHAAFTADVSATTRLGVVCPAPLDGLGAASLVLAHVTAFYDRYRAAGGEFFAYPDFYTFQLEGPVASYSMLDIWPGHKDVAVEAASVVDAITDRAVDTLLLPQGWRGEVALQPVQTAALHRLLRRAFVYDPAGLVAAPDLMVRCATEPICGWMAQVMASVHDAAGAQKAQRGDLVQSFRRLAVDRAVDQLRPSPDPPKTI